MYQLVLKENSPPHKIKLLLSDSLEIRNDDYYGVFTVQELRKLDLPFKRPAIQLTFCGSKDGFFESELIFEKFLFYLKIAGLYL